jgi:hypothetical protein
MKTRRNEPCSCGSGRKFKNCCEGSGIVKRSKLGFLWLLLPLGLAVGAVGALHDHANQEKVPAPERVWSEEHGHYHTPNAANAVAPEPPPPGKVWSAEHGHWHDANQVTAEGTDGVTSNVSQEAPGEAPPGKVWSPEHGHWHDAEAETPEGVTVTTTVEPGSDSADNSSD